MTDEVCSILKARALNAKSEFVFPSPEDPEHPIGSVRKEVCKPLRRLVGASGFEPEASCAQVRRIIFMKSFLFNLSFENK
jgi:hypothetical protein